MSRPTARRFPIRVEERYRAVLRLFGVGPDNAWVEIGDSELVASFGRFGARTPLANVVGWRIEGPWRAITAVGVRRSIRGGDVTFGGTARGGVRLDFRQAVRLRPFRIPALYVTVEDLEGFSAALLERGIPGSDARTRIAI
jgi:hypothetical protein